MLTLAKRIQMECYVLVFREEMISGLRIRKGKFTNSKYPQHIELKMKLLPHKNIFSVVYLKYFQFSSQYNLFIGSVKVLMLFCCCCFFQLEDDVIAKNMYFTKITDFIHNISSNNWFYIEFSILGFVGKQWIYFVGSSFQHTVTLKVLKLLNGKEQYDFYKNTFYYFCSKIRCKDLNYRKYIFKPNFLSGQTTEISRSTYIHICY